MNRAVSPTPAARHPQLLAITPPGRPPDLDCVDVWREVLVGLEDHGGLAVLLRQSGPDPRTALDRGGPLRALWQACCRVGIPMLCSASPGEDQLAIQAVERFGLAGVQLRADPDAARTRELRGRLPDALLGRSVHGSTPQRAPSAVDYTCLAPIFVPGTTADPGVEPKRPLGIEALRAWTEVCSPVVALGGVNSTTAAVCLQAGARGLASISTFFGPRARVVENLETLVNQVQTHLASSPRRNKHAASPPFP